MTINKLRGLKKVLSKKSILLTAITTSSILIVAQYFSSSAYAIENEIKPAAALTVTTATVSSLEWSDSIEASGGIVAWQEAIIGAQLTGLRLIDVLVDTGDQVKKGQIIARFESASLLNERALLKANLDEASALVLQASVDYKRALALSQTGGISRQNLLQAETQKQTTAAAALAVKAQLASNTLQLSYINVVAPDNGVISSRSATLGAIGSVGEELFRLIRDNRIEWHGQLTAMQATQLAVGQKVTLDLANNSTATAYVRQISPTMNPETRMITAYAAIEPNSKARAGMFATGNIQLNKTPALVVPAASVVIRDGRSYVFELVAATQQVIQRPVEVARRQGDYVEVIGKIQANTTVINQGAGFLSEGDIVKVVSENTSSIDSAISQKQEIL
ncbi:MULTISPECIES: efflux RND transporter periplasmic adaptor subunit [Marinomonas]|jgi:RND family efflux transporter MFP subunit|uniref:efflux RND transporter periplasmic adaptor subunit n=1 Tax=Marinomonas TaxID=28253 RepID=UPI001CA57945|nr:efflux RND transporter periplasmic adaptor subunit [Marinomonas lutimaris]